MKVSKMFCNHMLCDEASCKETPFCIDVEKPIFSFNIESDKYNTFVSKWRLIVSSERQNICNDEGDMWDSGIVNDSDIYNIIYDGQMLESKTIYFIKFFAWIEDEVIESEIGCFNTGLFYASDWKCTFVGLPTDKNKKDDFELCLETGNYAPYLRRKFNIDKNVVSAKAYATAYGLYELYINGTKNENYVLAPEWTDYQSSIQYQYYDLTEYLQKGENVIGAILGDGWFAGNVVCVGRNHYSDGQLGLMMHMEITYDDGTKDVILTDNKWKCSTGSIVYNDNLLGEFQDGRLEKEGWNLPGFDDDNDDWSEAVNVFPNKITGTRVKASIGPQIKLMHTLKPIDVFEDKNGLVIVDMGQNMVGVAKFYFKGKEGQKVVCRFGEMLDTDGTLYTANLKAALQTDTYILKGSEDGETFKPHFTFHGFRYIEISGLDYMPSKDDITGCVFYSACNQTGKIETSSPMVNQLFSNVMWGQRGNFLGVPTDCPQRNERMGWTGDAQVFCKTACYNMDCYGFFDKYMEDVSETQKPNGSVADVVPNVKWADGRDLVGNGNAAWADAMFIIPKTVYEMYGDKDILRKHYNGMEKFFKYLIGTTVGLLRPDFGYGDWLSIDDVTPKDVIGTAYFAYAAAIMAEVSEILEKSDRQAYYEDMFSKISKAWRDAYMDEDGIIKGDTQCCYLLALKMKLLKDDQIERAVNHLVRTIKRRNYHLSTGFVGVSYLLPILSEYGQSDIAYRLLLNETYPSWGYSVVNGATTIWERWNSYTKENGFGNAVMNSFNHYSLGSVSEWMYSYMGGIKPLKAGFREILIKPQLTNRIEYADVFYDSTCGGIRVKWENAPEGYKLMVKIPANTKAIVDFDGKMAEVVKGESYKEVENGFEICSGTYEMLVK